jgi:hypothetical protein
MSASALFYRRLWEQGGGKAALMQSLLLPDSEKSVKKLLEKMGRISAQIASLFHVYPYPQKVFAHIKTLKSHTLQHLNS